MNNTIMNYRTQKQQKKVPQPCLIDFIIHLFFSHHTCFINTDGETNQHSKHHDKVFHVITLQWITQTTLPVLLLTQM